MSTGRRRPTKKPIADELKEKVEPVKRIPKEKVITQGTPQFRVNCKFKNKKQKDTTFYIHLVSNLHAVAPSGL